MNEDTLKNKIIEQENRINHLEQKIENIYSTIQETIVTEIAKATYHQANAMDSRIDQFLFDAKIATCNEDEEFLQKLEIIKQNLNICNK